MLGPWAASAAARSLRLDDPYLASVYRHTDLFQALSRCEGEADLPDLTPQQLEAASGLQLVPELVSALRRHAPRLASVSLRMRADLVRSPTGRLPAGALL